MQTWERMKRRFEELQGYRMRPAPKPERHPLRWLGIGAAATATGAGLMYVFDPQVGRRRRTLARDRGAATVRRTVRRLEHLGNRTRAEARGRIARLRHLRRDDVPAANDATLADRVRSQLPRDPELHRHALNVSAQNGVVVLRGLVDRLDQIRTLVHAAERVPGVRRVESYLHLPDTPAPNKQALIQAEHSPVVNQVPPHGESHAEAAGA